MEKEEIDQKKRKVNKKEKKDKIFLLNRTFSLISQC